MAGSHFDSRRVGTLWFNNFSRKISMRQKRRLNRSDGIARNLRWVLVLLIMVGVVLVLRTCHA